jgi:hypothetical protein
MHSLDRVFVEPESGIRKGVWWSTSAKCWDANIVLIKASPGVFSQYSLSFILNLVLCYSWLCIKLIGIVWNRSCNKINLSVYPCYSYLLVAYHCQCYA